MTIITISIVGITAVMLAVELKGVKGEYGTYLAAAAGCFIFFYGIKKEPLRNSDSKPSLLLTVIYK